MARELTVCLNRRRVGRLVQDNRGETGFQYDASWLSDPRAVALSQSLPLREVPFTRRECLGFFEGILPEGENREIVARNLGISARNAVRMLEEIGGECAGAVTLIPSGEPLPDDSASYRPLSEPELADILRQLPRRPLLAGDDHIRLSLAGAQDKLAVYVAENQMALPLDGASSTHILKPALQSYAGLVQNEGMCLKLAQAVGLPVSAVTTGSAEGIDYLLVERYDRVRTDNGGGVARLHQEDFCQALGIVSENKYQNEGGPSLPQCFQLLRNASTVPARDIARLLDAVLFNYLIGNNDAHGKNFSLLYTTNDRQIWETSFAPLYDLICTARYPELSPKMAMKIGGEYRPDKLYAWHFEKFAGECGLNFPAVRRRLRAMIRLVLTHLPAVTTDDPVSGRIAGIIRERCERTLHLFQPVTAE